MTEKTGKVYDIAKEYTDRGYRVRSLDDAGAKLVKGYITVVLVVHANDEIFVIERIGRQKPMEYYR